MRPKPKQRLGRFLGASWGVHVVAAVVVVVVAVVVVVGMVVVVRLGGVGHVRENWGVSWAKELPFGTNRWYNTMNEDRGSRGSCPQGVTHKIFSHPLPPPD